MNEETKRYQKEYRLKNRERISRQKKQWSLKNSDKVQISRDRWASKNREKLLDSRRKYNQTPSAKLSKKNWNIKNKNYAKSYRLKNRIRISESKKIWSKNNPVKVTINRIVQHGKRRDIFKLTTQVEHQEIKKWIKSILEKEFSSCSYCGGKITKKQIEFDHKTPISRGGLHKLENLCISCVPCNRSKGSKTLEEWKN